MNKNLYRIVFNAKRGQRMAVAETATSQGKGASAETRTGTGVAPTFALEAGGFVESRDQATSLSYRVTSDCKALPGFL